jgi:hypothetical protein
MSTETLTDLFGGDAIDILQEIVDTADHDIGENPDQGWTTIDSWLWHKADELITKVEVWEKADKERTERLVAEIHDRDDMHSLGLEPRG